ncbi:hemagglutinin repeat-containing protein [Propionivibrio sp.]|uniref:hemagglutinin repeat-containing protein n=1 Tax=Propionivibrio sp. TaxID=2212460 RepID=UPI00341909EB
MTIQGSKATAARNLTLTADDEIKLLAARNTAEQHSTNKNRSASVGIGFALGGTQNGFTIQAGVSGGKGQANGTDLAWSNTHVEAGNLLAFESGGNTTLRGAVARGEQVIANVGKDLTIESLQDLSTYDSKQKSLGASVSLCILPFCVGATPVSGSVSASASKVNSDYASVTEQSALRAGGGGFDVKVKNDTDLKGGAITSTQQAIDDNKNAFHTDGTLTLSDIDNKASYSAKSASINIGTGFSAAGALVPQGTSMGFGKDSGSASSTTRAAISGIAGNTNARTGDAETGIQPIFDQTKVQKEIDAQTKITQMFGQLAPKAAADFAKTQADNLRGRREQRSRREEMG